jgi:hypothetical protein
LVAPGYLPDLQMITTRSVRPFILLLALTVPSLLQGCDAPAAPCTNSQDASSQQLATLQRQKADAVYEIQLRQDELDQMMASVKGAVGVSNQWLERKSQLTEKITQLKVKENDIDLQISALK